MAYLTHGIIEDIVTRALAEDIGIGDITTQAVIDPAMTTRLQMVTRQDCVLAGLRLAEQTFHQHDQTIVLETHCYEGHSYPRGTVLMSISGNAASIVTAERVALNFVQHLSGIATLTHQCVQAVAHTRAHILDTRKTIPGLRLLAKYAVAAGGGRNHRLRLDDGVLIKDNHIALCGGMEQAIFAACRADIGKIQVECDTLEQLGRCLEMGVTWLLLDNMSLENLRTAVAMAQDHAERNGQPQAVLEASGGMTLATIAAVAETGVDYISMGQLTMSAPSVDIGLDMVSWEGGV